MYNRVKIILLYVNCGSRGVVARESDRYMDDDPGSIPGPDE